MLLFYYLLGQLTLSLSLSTSPKVVIFCPVYEPHPGGGASYFPLISKYLSQYYDTDVLTERHPDCPTITGSEGLTVRRVFVQRDTMNGKTALKNIIAFSINSFIFFKYLFMLLWERKQLFIIFTRNYHTHYLVALKLFRFAKKNTVLINDIRTGFPINYQSLDLSFFDLSLSNSEIIECQLRQFPNLRGQRHTNLPNIVRLPTIDDVGVGIDGLQERSFSLFCGILDTRKSIDVVVPVMSRLYLEHGLMPVVVGREGDHKVSWLKASFGDIPYRHLQSVASAQMFWLERYAEIVLLPSRLEGIPRVALEVLSFHGRIVLPPCCPEFSECLDLNHLTAESVFNLAVTRRSNEYSGYDVTKHCSITNLDKYRSILGL